MTGVQTCALPIYNHFSDLREMIIRRLKGGVKEDGTPDPTVVLEHFLAGTKKGICDSPESESDRRAEVFLQQAAPDVWSRINVIANEIASEVKTARATAEQRCREILDTTSDRKSVV